MKRRNFLAAIAATTAGTALGSEIVNVSYEAWSKYLDSNQFQEMIFNNQTGQWYPFIRIDLKETPVRYGPFKFCLNNTNKSALVFNDNSEYVQFLPLTEKEHHDKTKQMIVDAVIKINHRSGEIKHYFFEIRYKNLSNLFGMSL